MADGAYGGSSMSKRITIILEGKTEKVFIPHLRKFLGTRLSGPMPRIDILPYHGRIPTGDKLKRVVDLLLNDGERSADAVIALTDVYTGTREFVDAADAKAKMRGWVGSNKRFYPHAAQYDFEAWLLPYWPEIQRRAGSNRSVPSRNPESINHDNPPSSVLQMVYRTGNKGKSYVKTRDAKGILENQDLLVSAQACPELKSFLNTILSLCGGSLIQ